MHEPRHDERGARTPATGRSTGAEDRPPVGEPLVAPRRSRDRGEAPGGADATAAPVPPPPPPPPPLAGRVALVTGAASELGTAFASAFAAAGAEVHLLDADLQALRELARTLPGGTRSLVLCCDLGSVEEIRSVGEFLEQAEVPPDVVVHAATVDSAGSVLDSPVEDLDEHYLIGVRGPAVLLQELAPHLNAGATVVFADRAEGPTVTDAHRSVADAARARLVDAVRGELLGRGVTVMSARAQPGSPAAEVASGVVDALAGERDALVLELTLGLRPSAPGD